MNRIAAAVAAAALAAATPVAAQDIAGPVAAAVDQFGQSMAESMTGGPGLFVTAQGEAPMPAAASMPMTITIKGTGKTAVEAVADRNAQLERVRSVANRFDVAMDEPGFTMFASPSNRTAQITLADRNTPGLDRGIREARISVEVSDVDALHAEAVRLGLEIVYPLTNEPWGIRRFFVKDPDGTVINVAMHL